MAFFIACDSLLYPRLLYVTDKLSGDPVSRFFACGCLHHHLYPAQLQVHVQESPSPFPPPLRIFFSQRRTASRSLQFTLLAYTSEDINHIFCS